MKEEQIARVKQKLKDTINRNINQYFENDKFIRLIYNKNPSDSKIARHDLQMFINKLRRKFSNNNIQYVAIMEVVKYDTGIEKVYWNVLLFNVPYVECKILESWWDKGIVCMQAIGKYVNLGEYFVRDLDNDLSLLNSKNEIMYSLSKGLK